MIFSLSNQYIHPAALSGNYNDDDILYQSQTPSTPFGDIDYGITYIQERMSSLFMETGYENIYLAIVVAATALFVIETLVRVYRIYEANNKRRRRRKRSNIHYHYPEETKIQFKRIIIGISTSYLNFE